MITPVNRVRDRKTVHRRIRRKIAGTASRPRLCVYRSLNHIYAQAIDDHLGVTLASASSRESGTGGAKNRGNVDSAKAVGKVIGERVKEKGIDAVVFDRGGCLYHGRIRALAEAARAAGLIF